MATVQIRPIIERALSDAGVSSYQQSQYRRQIDAVANSLQGRADQAVRNLRNAGLAAGLSQADVDRGLTNSGLATPDSTPREAPEFRRARQPDPEPERSEPSTDRVEDFKEKVFDLLSDVIDVVSGRR